MAASLNGQPQALQKLVLSWALRSPGYLGPQDLQRSRTFPCPRADEGQAHGAPARGCSGEHGLGEGSSLLDLVPAGGIDELLEHDLQHARQVLCTGPLEGLDQEGGAFIGGLELQGPQD
jgi:hypothetical protein